MPDLRAENSDIKITLSSISKPTVSRNIKRPCHNFQPMNCWSSSMAEVKDLGEARMVCCAITHSLT